MSPSPRTSTNSSFSITYGRPPIVTGIVDCGMLMLDQLSLPRTSNPARGTSTGPSSRAWMALTS